MRVDLHVSYSVMKQTLYLHARWERYIGPPNTLYWNAWEMPPSRRWRGAAGPKGYASLKAEIISIYKEALAWSEGSNYKDVHLWYEGARTDGLRWWPEWFYTTRALFEKQYSKWAGSFLKGLRREFKKPLLREVP